MITSRTVVDICNLALIEIGETRILNLDDATEKNARVCKQYYTQVLEEVFREHWWNCLTQRATLTQDATAPAFGWLYRYQLPTDFVRLLTLNQDNQNRRGADEFKVEANFLLTNEPIAHIKYISRIDDPSIYDALLVEAIYTKLAEKVSRILTGSDGMRNQLRQQYEFIVGKAKLTDSQESESNENHPLLDELCDSPLVNSRHLYGGYGNQRGSSYTLEPFVSRDPTAQEPEPYFPAMKQSFPIPGGQSTFTITPQSGMSPHRLESALIRREDSNNTEVTALEQYAIAANNIDLEITITNPLNSGNTHELILNFTT